MKKLLSVLICLLMIGQCVMFVYAADFTDVKTDAYYADAVAWAVENNITSGTTPTTFSPNKTCTRAQAVSFIWRSMGCPEPKGSVNPFTDVKEKDYFYKAVMWAVENGVTAGMSADKFAPNQDCTRAQIVTFLWNAEGKPVISADNPFTDVKESHWFYTAVLWAVENNITAGMSADKFAPNNKCTRAQIVCFLERSCKNLRVVSQPEDYQMRSSSEEASFTVEIKGGEANYYYDWTIFKDNDETKVSHGATDATSDTLTFEVTDYDFDSYRAIAVQCVVTDVKGNTVATQWAEVLPKELYVAPLVIKTQPEDFYMTSSQDTAVFNLEIDGCAAPFTYRWVAVYENRSGWEEKSEVFVQDEKVSSFVFDVTDYDFDLYDDITVYCEVTDANGNKVISAEAQVYPKGAAPVKPLTIIAQPVDYQMQSSQEYVSFSVEIEGHSSNYNYVWHILKDNDETKITHNAFPATRDTVEFEVSDYDFDDYRDIAVYCVITDTEGNSVTTSWASVLQA